MLTLFSIIVAFILFGLLSAMKMALVGGVEMAGKDRLLVRHKVSLIQLLPYSYKARMLRIPGVTGAAHQTWFGGYHKEPKEIKFFQSPVEAADFFPIFPEFSVPPEQLKAFEAKRTGAIIGRKLAERYKWKIGDKVPITSPLWSNGKSNTWEFDIVGIYDGTKKGTDTTGFFFRYDYFDEARAESMKGKVGWYSIRVADDDKAAEIAKLVDAEFENSAAETKTEPEGAFVAQMAKQIGNIALIVASILGAVFFTILLVTGNTIAQSVRERTGELGVLKAIGFTNRQVMLMVLMESLLLSLLGGLIGLGIAWAVTSQGDPTNGMLPLFYFPQRDILTGVGIAAALGLITGIFPALQAMRLRVADALRRM